MKTNLPTTPGPWWFREEDGDEWELVLVVFYNDPFIEPTAKYVCSEFENDLKAMEGQWAKAHKPDEGIDAWAVFSKCGSPVSSGLTEHAAKLNRVTTGELIMGAITIGYRWKQQEKQGYTIQPVTIFKREVER